MAFLTNWSASNVDALPFYFGKLLDLQSSRSSMLGAKTDMVSFIRSIQLRIACADSLVGNLAIRRSGDFFMFLF